MPTRTALRIALFACLMSTTSIRGALGQAASETARPAAGDAGQTADLRQRGNEAMEERRYGDALSLYSQAYSMSKDPALLYNQGRALEALGRFPEALVQLEMFDAEAPAELKRRVPGLHKMIVAVRSHVAIVEVKSNVTGGQIYAQGKPMGTTPLAAPLKLAAGKTTFEIVAEGYEPYRRELDLVGGVAVDIEATLLAKPAAPTIDTSRVEPVAPAPAERKAITSQWWFWTGAGVLVAGGAALAAALLIERPADRGDIQPGRVPVSLFHF